MVAILVSLATPSHADGRALFFDNFRGTGFPTGWTSNNVTATSGAVEQSNGILTVTWLKSQSTLNPYPPRIIQNSTQPIVDENTGNTTIFMAWKLQPFNMTAIQGKDRRVQLNFGLRTCIPPSGGSCSGTTSYLGWFVEQSDIYYDNIGEKSPVYAVIVNPANGIPNNRCYTTTILFSTSSTPNCQPAIRMSQPRAPFNLAQPHFFIMEGKLFTVGSGSWLAFSVDSNAWVNVTQAACVCLSGNDIYQKLYPFIEIAGSGTFTENVGAFVNYVLVSNYIPATLPTGTIPTGSGTLTQGIPWSDLIYSGAYAAGGGNLAFGGLFISLIATCLISVPASIIAIKTTGHRPPGFFFVVVCLGWQFLFMLTGIIPWWIMIVTGALGMAVAFKVLPGEI